MSNVTEMRVYYEDTDAGGFVYYANYLKFCERGRSELLRELGFENKKLLDEQGVGFVVKSLNAEYNKPAVLDDMLSVHTDVQEVKSASITMSQRVNNGDENLFEMQVTIVCININNGMPTRMPSDVKEGFKKHE